MTNKKRAHPRHLTVLTLGALLIQMLSAAAKAETPAVYDAGPYPEQFDAIVKAWATSPNQFKDPDSIKLILTRGPRLDFFQADPGLIKKAMGMETPQIYSWRVCYKINGRNSYGGYVGFKDYLIYIRNGAISGVDGDDWKAISEECTRDADPPPAPPSQPVSSTNALSFGVLISPTLDLTSASGNNCAGAIVAFVISDSVAAKALIRVGDCLLSFNNIPTDISNVNSSLLAGVKAGDRVPVVVKRQGQSLNLVAQF